jgi:1,4-dihydroxy-2-naphthoyl-CoA hydrolase
MLTPENFNALGAGKLPGHLGIVVTHVSESRTEAELAITETLMAPNGFLHAGTVITLADTCAGYGCLVNLPPGAIGFTTIELKSNHLGTARDGTIVGSAEPAHLGKTTQVWDSVVTHKESGKTIALFRCTQMILYAKKAALA